VKTRWTSVNIAPLKKFGGALLAEIHWIFTASQVLFPDSNLECSPNEEGLYFWSWLYSTVEIISRIPNDFWLLEMLAVLSVAKKIAHVCFKPLLLENGKWYDQKKEKNKKKEKEHSIEAIDRANI